VTTSIIDQLPTLLVFVAGTLLAAAAATGLHALILPRLPHDLLEQHNPVSGVIMTVIGTLYAVVLGFAVVVVWQQFNTAADLSNSEADALADVYRLSSGLPEPKRGKIRLTIRAYADSVLYREWPEMNHEGRSDPHTQQLALAVAHEVDGIQPATPAATNLQAAALSALVIFLDSRRDRLTYLDSRIPAVLWYALIAGGLTTLGFTFLFGLRSTRLQLLMTAGLAGMIAMSLIAINELDSPLEGDTHVQPTAWQLFEAQIGQIR